MPDIATSTRNVSSDTINPISNDSSNYSSNVVTVEPKSNVLDKLDAVENFDNENNSSGSSSGCPDVCKCNFSDMLKLICRFDLPNFNVHISKFLPKINCVSIPNPFYKDQFNCNCSCCVCFDTIEKRKGASFKPNANNSGLDGISDDGAISNSPNSPVYV